jgi:hypothetical protein
MIGGKVGNFMRIYREEDEIEEEEKETERKMFGILVVAQLCIQRKYLRSSRLLPTHLQRHEQ